MDQIQKTLIVFKPDAVARGLVGEILARFERAGLKIVATTMRRPDREFFHHHYETIGTMITRHGEKIFDTTVDMMQSGPVIAAVLEGVAAVEIVRKLVGPTEPKSAAPGTIRGDFAHINYAQADGRGIGIANLIHASGDADEAKKEIEHWFAAEEIYDYEANHERHTR